MTDKEHIAQLHRFLDELWIMYKDNESLRLRLLAAKASRWEWARITTDEELDALLTAATMGVQLYGDIGPLLETAQTPSERSPSSNRKPN